MKEPERLEVDTPPAARFWHPAGLRWPDLGATRQAGRSSGRRVVLKTMTSGEWWRAFVQGIVSIF